MKARNVLIFIGFLAAVLFSASNAHCAWWITNTCTSTYVDPGTKIVMVSGWDTVMVGYSWPPYINIQKIVKNVRTGEESDFMVTCLMGDTLEFKIIWSNAGEAKADTITLGDYIPFAFTYIGSSLTDTEVNCTGSASEAAGYIVYRGYNAVGADPGPAANGQFKFMVTVN